MKKEQKNQHPITYEYIRVLIIILMIGFIVISALLYWMPKEKDVSNARQLWHCFSKDGRINYVIVESKIKPSYLPVAGNEGVEYYCDAKEAVDFEKYWQAKILI